MATINFKGKSAVWNHHLSVPYHTLDEDNKLSVEGDNNEENIIIEGDNLLALKALLPKYQGRIKCVYIDPPYNTGTGNGAWVYDDKVNSPLIKDWLNREVGFDDLTRHDKWLCMMTPRLKLLKELLSNDGMIFISISDIELHNLTCLMNEIFYEKNYLATIARLTKRGGNKGEYNKPKKDYVLCYFKDKDSIQTEMFGRKLEQSDIKWEEEDFNGKRKFIQGDIPYREKLDVRKNQRYYIEAPDGSLMIPPGNVFPVKKLDGEKITPVNNKDKCWSWSVERYKLEKEIGRFIFKKSNKSPFLDENNKQSKWTIYKKVFEDELAVKKEIFIDFLDKFPNSLGTKALKDLKMDDYFDNPKPPQLIEYLISIASDDDSIILDSFAGSGTTAEAVIELNNESGNRRFILVQMVEEINENKAAYISGYRFVNQITQERVKRVINRSEIKPGFTYYKLGPSIDAETLLAGKLPKYEEFAKYVFYLATGKNHPNEKDIKKSDYFVGELIGTSVYLIYDQNPDSLKKLAITLDWAEVTNNNNPGKKIVYAPACFLDEEHLEKFNIRFVSIPYNLFEQK